jgi:hypothetical protein
MSILSARWPAGIYTKEYLSGLGLWDKLQSKMVPTENVRAALAAVESGNGVGKLGNSTLTAFESRRYHKPESELIA